MTHRQPSDPGARGDKWKISDPARAALKPLGVVYARGVSPRDPDLSGIPEAVKAAEQADVVLLAIGEDLTIAAKPAAGPILRCLVGKPT